MKTKPMLMLALLLNVLLGQQVQAFYNPSTGRWLSRDPHFELGFDGDWPTEDSYRGQDSVTIHAYVGNNPVNFIDATGLFSIEDILGMALNPPCGSVSVQGKLKLVSWHVTGIGIGNKLACNGVRALLRGKINEALNKLPYSNDYACKNRNCVSVASFGPLTFHFLRKCLSSLLLI